ncbi:hypothetical protein A0H81_06752 [Grifola frondosa]|uniref:VWFA domain-containing protein n=1 Tax=Grifola frondosa TaxID=5627 RepID=A0A1C7M7N5_GRIFR|nr:hypothetical protein A0H81_06752 [Grifola frondosa]
MTALRSSSFSSPAMPGDDIAVFFLVEDSGAMAGIWDDVRAFYLPMLLENLRTADMTVAMQVSWMTSSPTSSPSTVLVNDPAQCRDIPDFPFNPTMGTAISSAVILSSAREGRQTTRHFILIAATAPPPVDERYGFDPWHDVAVALCQEYIRLHVILNAGPDMRIFHDLFKRSLHLQNNSEIPSWFQIDPRTYSIRLSGRPQYVRDPGPSVSDYR